MIGWRDGASPAGSAAVTAAAADATRSRPLLPPARPRGGSTAGRSSTRGSAGPRWPSTGRPSSPGSSSHRIFITHFHPDHVGAAADVHELTGAPVHQGRLDYAQCALVWRATGLGDRDRRAGSTSNGVPQENVDELIALRLRLPPVRPLPARPAASSSRATGSTAGRPWPRPGHADGQLCLLRDGMLVSADHLLARITPTVGLWPESRPDPLGDFLAALERHDRARAAARAARARRPDRGPRRPGPRAHRAPPRAARGHRGGADGRSRGQGTRSRSTSSARAEARRHGGSPSPRRSRTSSGSCARIAPTGTRTPGRVAYTAPPAWTTSFRLVPAPRIDRGMSDLLRILAILLLVLGNAFFVAAEYALVTARRTRLEQRRRARAAAAPGRR